MSSNNNARGSPGGGARAQCWGGRRAKDRRGGRAGGAAGGGGGGGGGGAEAGGAARRRPGDFAARYGGEELAIILPQTNRDSALLVAQHLRNAIEQLGIEHRNAPPGIVTCSIGVGVKNPGSDRDPQALFAEADAAMYKAKDAGRNQVCC